MHFTNYLTRKNYEEELRQIDKNIYAPRLFEPIEIRPQLWLSIQANSLVQCRPRTDFSEISDVTHWELMLFNGHNLIKIADILPDLISLAEIELYANEELYCLVPTDLVQELYDALLAENKMTA